MSGELKEEQALMSRQSTLLIDETGTPSSWETLIAYYQNLLIIAIQDAVTRLTEFNNDTGIATGGSNTTLENTDRDYGVDMWAKGKIEFDIGGMHYFRLIVSNTADTITFDPLPVGVVVTSGTEYQLKAAVERTNIDSVNGTVQTTDDWTARFKALNDETVKGLLKSIGDIDTGDSIIARLGVKADGAVTDPTADSTMFGYIKGLIKILGDIGAGKNVITLLDDIYDAIVELSQPVQTRTIANVTMTVANDEYTYTLPANTRRFQMIVKDGSPADHWWQADDTGHVKTGDSSTMKLYNNDTYFEQDGNFGGKVLYFASDKAGAIMTIISWI